MSMIDSSSVWFWFTHFWFNGNREEFDAEKSGNVEKLEQLKEMESNIIGAVKAIEKLRSEIATARSRA